MRKIPIEKLNAMDCAAIQEARNFAKRKLDHPNEISLATTYKRKDGLAFYVCMTGSPLFRPGIVLASRYKNKGLTMALISGIATERDLELLMDLIELKNGVPNFQEVSTHLRARGKVVDAEIF